MLGVSMLVFPEILRSPQPWSSVMINTTLGCSFFESGWPEQAASRAIMQESEKNLPITTIFEQLKVFYIRIFLAVRSDWPEGFFLHRHLPRGPISRKDHEIRFL